MHQYSQHFAGTILGWCGGNGWGPSPPYAPWTPSQLPLSAQGRHCCNCHLLLLPFFFLESCISTHKHTEASPFEEKHLCHLPCQEHCIPLSCFAPKLNNTETFDHGQLFLRFFHDGFWSHHSTDGCCELPGNSRLPHPRIASLSVMSTQLSSSTYLKRIILVSMEMHFLFFFFLPHYPLLLCALHCPLFLFTRWFVPGHGLSSFLFSLGSILSHSKSVKCHLYADDSQIYSLIAIYLSPYIPPYIYKPIIYLISLLRPL